MITKFQSVTNGRGAKRISWFGCFGWFGQNWYTAFRKSKSKRTTVRLNLPNAHQNFLGRYFLAILTSYWCNLFKIFDEHLSNYLQGCHILTEGLKIWGWGRFNCSAKIWKESAPLHFWHPWTCSRFYNYFFLFKIDLVAGTLWKNWFVYSSSLLAESDQCFYSVFQVKLSFLNHSAQVHEEILAFLNKKIWLLFQIKECRQSLAGFVSVCPRLL